MNPSSIRLPGAGAVPTIGTSAPASAAAGSGPAGGGEHVIDVTEASFQAEVVERSMHTPVVVDFWAEWCGPCKQLSPVLERMAAEDGGKWVLAKIDVDANPRLAQAAQVQGIPAVKAIIKGQVVDLFTGAAPASQVRGVLDQLMTLAAEQGLTASPEAAVAGSDLPPPAALDPDLERGDDAFAAGDLDAAEAAYTALLNREPANLDAQSSLARVSLARRTATITDREFEGAERDAASTDDEAVLRAADVLLLTDRVEQAFAAIIEVVRRGGGDARDKARARLLELFLIVGDQDPRVLTARRNLASALF